MNIKELVTISPNTAGQNTRLSCETRIGSEWFVLTKNWKMIRKEQLGEGPYAKEEIMTIPFSRSQGVFRFAFDLFPEREMPKGDDIDEIEWKQHRQAETDKHTAAFQFFAKHMQMKVVGMKNPHLIGQPMFVMNFVNHHSINTCIAHDKKVQVYNKVNEMSLQEKLNLALYFQPSLYGKRHSEIKNALINLQTGLLLKEEYLDQALNYDAKNVTVAMGTYVNKAIQMDLLKSPNGQAGYFLPGNVYVGANDKEVLGYFLKDPASYNNVIVPRVNQLEKLPEDDLQFVQEDLGKRLSAMADFQKHKHMAPAQWDAKLTAAKAEAEALGVRNIDGKNYTTIMDEIDKIKRGDHKHIPKDGAKLTKDDMNRLANLKLIAKDLNIKGYGLFTDPDKLAARIEEAKMEKLVAEK